MTLCLFQECHTSLKIYNMLRSKKKLQVIKQYNLWLHSSTLWFCGNKIQIQEKLWVDKTLTMIISDWVEYGWFWGGVILCVLKGFCINNIQLFYWKDVCVISLSFTLCLFPCYWFSTWAFFSPPSPLQWICDNVWSYFWLSQLVGITGIG